MIKLNTEQRRKVDFILKSPDAKLSSLNNTEIKSLAILWCYYSGKIEGNTYTYVETEALLKDGITSEKRYEDAKMLKNLYNTFISELNYIHKDGEKEEINEKLILRLHSSISAELVSAEESGNYRSRGVRITGTDYIPPKETHEIRVGINEILYFQETIADPLEKAVYLHCNLAKLQPFIDGNKRTSRMVEAIVMLNNNLIPVFSSKDKDILNYRKSLMAFYETGSYSAYADYFLNRQIERINEITSAEQQYKEFNIGL